MAIDLKASIKAPSTVGRILYMTDKFKVSTGYKPAFNAMVKKMGIRPEQVIISDIYNLVPTPLMRKGNEKLWRFDPEQLPEIEAAFRQRISTFKPTLIVVSCPAVIGVLVNGDSRLGTLDKLRGGVYKFDGITVIVTFPITAINTHVDTSLVYGEDEENKYDPYKVPSGNWILYQDWRKVGRYFTGNQRRLPPFRYSVCRTIADCEAARDWLASCLLISCDIETGLFPAQITCVGYSGINEAGVVRTFVIAFHDPSKPSGCFWDDESDHVRAWEIMGEINDNPVVKTMQNGSYDSSYFVKYRIGIRNYLLDSMYLWFALNTELPKSLDFISSILLDNHQYWKDDIKGKENESSRFNVETYWRYNGLDCYNTLFNTMYLVKLMESNEAMRVAFEDTWRRAMSGFKMSMRGIRADFNRRDEHRIDLEKERDSALARVRFLVADPEFNVNSPAQKSSLLYDVLGARPRNARGRYIDPKKVGQKGNTPSSGDLALKLIKTEHPIFRRVIQAVQDTMAPDKQISNVCNMKLFTNRFRTNFQPAGTEMQRFSSKASNFWDGGNVQNIRKKYRDWLIPDVGCVFLEFDYSQSDDVFISYESEDPDKIALVESGRDGHAVHGELFFQIPYEEIVAGKRAGDPRIIHPTLGIRSLSKRVVHGTNFQMAAMTLYTTMGREAVTVAAILMGYPGAEHWPQEKLMAVCQQMMNAYRKRYKRLTPKEWYKEIAYGLAKYGTQTNAYGITRRFLGDPKDNGTQREATAFYGQSNTAANMNRAQYEIDFGYMPRHFRDSINPHFGQRPLQMDLASHGFRFMAQVHDSFLVQLRLNHDRWEEAAHNLLTVMSRPVIIKGREVSVRTESEFMFRWGSKAAVEWKGLSDARSLRDIVSQAAEAEFELSLKHTNRMKELA